MPIVHLGPKELLIMTAIGFFFLIFSSINLVNSQVSVCPDKCTNSVLYGKGTFDEKAKICRYEIIKNCDYGCRDDKDFSTTECNMMPNNTQSSLEIIYDKINKIGNNTDVCSNILTKVSKAEMSVGGTEYLTGDNATIFLQLVQSGSPINNGYCNFDAYFPNKTTLYNNKDMVYLSGSDGLYYNEFVVPEQAGVYMLSASCLYPLNLTVAPPTNDTMIWSGASSTNYGSATSMITGTWLGQIGISLVSFNITDAPQNFSSAKLFLYKFSGSSYNISLKRVTSVWAELNVTWGNQPTYGANVYDTISPALNSWNSWDITELVRGWKNGTYTNYGIMLNQTKGTGGMELQYFYTKEYGNYIPFLFIMANSTPLPQEIKGSGEMHVSNFNATNINYTYFDQRFNTTFFNQQTILSFLQNMNSSIVNLLAQLPSLIWNYPTRTTNSTFSLNISNYTVNTQILNLTIYNTTANITNITNPIEITNYTIINNVTNQTVNVTDYTIAISNYTVLTDIINITNVSTTVILNVSNVTTDLSNITVTHISDNIIDDIAFRVIQYMTGYKNVLTCIFTGKCG
jgi:hypothetical protein